MHVDLFQPTSAYLLTIEPHDSERKQYQNLQIFEEDGSHVTIYKPDLTFVTKLASILEELRARLVKEEEKKRG